MHKSKVKVTQEYFLQIYLCIMCNMQKLHLMIFEHYIEIDYKIMKKI